MNVKHLKILLIVAGSFSLLLGVALAITVYGIVFGAVLIFGGIVILNKKEIYVAKDMHTIASYKGELIVWCVLFFVGLNPISSALLLYIVLYMHYAMKKESLAKPATATAANVTHRGLEQLTKLHQDGLISEEDFNEMKQNLQAASNNKKE
jgi:uncharacterized membrane protein